MKNGEVKEEEHLGGATTSLAKKDLVEAIDALAELKGRRRRRSWRWNWNRRRLLATHYCLLAIPRLHHHPHICNSRTTPEALSATASLQLLLLIFYLSLISPFCVKIVISPLIFLPINFPSSGFPIFFRLKAKLLFFTFIFVLHFQ